MVALYIFDSLKKKKRFIMNQATLVMTRWLAIVL